VNCPIVALRVLYCNFNAQSYIFAVVNCCERVLLSGDSRMKKREGNCGAKEKSREGNINVSPAW